MLRKGMLTVSLREIESSGKVGMSQSELLLV